MEFCYLVAMAQCTQSAQEFVQNAFGPTVAVLCSHDAEVLAQKNNLSVVEMLRPFSCLTNEGKLKKKPFVFMLFCSLI